MLHIISAAALLRVIHPTVIYRCRAARPWAKPYSLTPFMSPLPWKVLTTIASRNGGSITRRELVDQVWGDREDGGPLGTTNLIDVTLKRLRDDGYNIKGGYSFGWWLEPGKWNGVRR